mgnify:FL=1
MNNEHSQLIALFENILREAQPEELGVLERLLFAIHNVQTGREKTYLHGAFRYRGEMTGENSYEATIELTPFFLNNLHILHGGITATFADTAMGTLVGLNLPKDQTSVTSEIKVNYLRPIIGKEIRCKAEIVHRGKSLWVTECKIYDQGKESPAAYASASFFVIPKK